MLDFIRRRKEDEDDDSYMPLEVEAAPETYDPDPGEFLSPDWGRDLLDDIVNGPMGMAVGMTGGGGPRFKLPKDMDILPGVLKEGVDWKDWGESLLHNIEGRLAGGKGITPGELQYRAAPIAMPTDIGWSIAKASPSRVNNYGETALDAYGMGWADELAGTADIQQLALFPELQGLYRGKTARDIMDRLIAEFEAMGIKSIYPGEYSPFTEKILQHFRGK